MDDNERVNILRRARRVDSLSRNDMHELKQIYRTGYKPFASDLAEIFRNAHRDDDAVLLKAAIEGMGKLSTNEKFRLDEAISRRGRRLPG